MKKIGKGRVLFGCAICFCGVLAIGTAIYAKNKPIATEVPLTDTRTSLLEAEGVDTMAECAYIELDNVRNVEQAATEVQIGENDVPMSSAVGTDSD